MPEAKPNPHADVDEAILQRVAQGDGPSFSTILAAVRAGRRGICQERLCDKRLQALRRKNKIVYGGAGKGWAIRAQASL